MVIFLHTGKTECSSRSLFNNSYGTEISLTLYSVLLWAIVSVVDGVLIIYEWCANDEIVGAVVTLIAVFLFFEMWPD